MYSRFYSVEKQLCVIHKRYEIHREEDTLWEVNVGQILRLQGRYWLQSIGQFHRSGTYVVHDGFIYYAESVWKNRAFSRGTWSWLKIVNRHTTYKLNGITRGNDFEFRYIDFLMNNNVLHNYCLTIWHRYQGISQPYAQRQFAGVELIDV